MNVYSVIEDIDTNKISFYKAIVNKLPHYTYFYKIIYNIETFTLNAILIDVNIKELYITKE